MDTAAPDLVIKIDDLKLLRSAATALKKVDDQASIIFSKRTIAIQCISSAGVCMGNVSIKTKRLADYQWSKIVPKMALSLDTVLKLIKSYRSYAEFRWYRDNADYLHICCEESAGHVKKRVGRICLQVGPDAHTVPGILFGPPKAIESAAIVDVYTSLAGIQAGSASAVCMTIAYQTKEFVFSIYSNGDRSAEQNRCNCDEYEYEDDNDIDGSDYAVEDPSKILVLHPELGKMAIVKAFADCTAIFELQFSSNCTSLRISFWFPDDVGHCAILLPSMTQR